MAQGAGQKICRRLRLALDPENGDKADFADDEKNVGKGRVTFSSGGVEKGWVLGPNTCLLHSGRTTMKIKKTA